MDDLISRTAAIDAIHKAVRDHFPQGKDGEPMTETQLMVFEINKAICTAVKELPSVDAVEVVRCKDCRWCEDLDENGWCWCGNDGCGMPQDGFCSYGERKEE